MASFYKYHGLGNDFILVDNRDNSISVNQETVEKMCHRFFGIGADGLILAENSTTGDIRMIIYNSDGSRAGMCGNGLRCFSKFSYEILGIRREQMVVETDSGILTAEIILKSGAVISVKVNMGVPVFESDKIPCTITESPIIGREINIEDRIFKITSLLMGVPHTVIFTNEIDDNSVVENGKIVENSKFFPRKTNVNFVKIISENEIFLRTWERGAGYTYACGTGACASVVAGAASGLLKKKVLVHLRGGDLSIEWKENSEVYMEGPAVMVYKGEYNL